MPFDVRFSSTCCERWLSARRRRSKQAGSPAATVMARSRARGCARSQLGRDALGVRPRVGPFVLVVSHGRYASPRARDGGAKTAEPVKGTMAALARFQGRRAELAREARARIRWDTS